MQSEGRFFTIGLLSLLLLFVLTAAPGCAKEEADGDLLGPNGKATEDGKPPGEPWDWFPTRAGTRWVYEITIGEVEPLTSRTVIWPTGDMAISYLVRGRLLPLLEEQPPDTFRLAISVKGPAARQGPLEFPGSVELSIETDELGIYQDVEQLFWAVTESGRFMVTEVATYPPTTPGAPTGSWGTWGAEDGYSMREMFFGGDPGMGVGVGIGEEATEYLRFTGLDGSYLHFVRQVEDSDEQEAEEDSLFSVAFTEETWFERGKGLVRLEQKVAGETSMVWELVEFSEGAE